MWVAPRSAMSEPERGGVHLPGDALGLSSRDVGEKTELTSSASFVQPSGGSFFAAAQAVTGVVNKSRV
jgi:hypothetical protein